MPKSVSVWVALENVNLDEALVGLNGRADLASVPCIAATASLALACTVFTVVIASASLKNGDERRRRVRGAPESERPAREMLQQGLPS
jgi:hypothetical protein